jgi:hypothetical protein
MADIPSPGPSPSPRRVRLSGVAAAETRGAVLAEVTMHAEGQETPSGLWTRPFDLALESGERVRVEVAPDARVFGGEEAARGAWREVEELPLASPFREKAPGPHVEVKLRGKVVSAGDPVEILAEVLEEDTADGPMGLRDSPPRRISAVRAAAIGTGPLARRKLDALLEGDMETPALTRPAKDGTGISWTGVLTVLAVLAGLGLLGKAVFTAKSILVDLLAAIVVVVAAGYDLIEVDVETPQFRAGATPKHEAERYGGFLVSFLGVLLILGCLCVDVYHALSGSEYTTYPVAPLAGAAALCFQAVTMWPATRYPARMARLLLAEPDSTPPPDGAWGVGTGRVEDPTPLTGTMEPAAMGVSTASASPELLHEGTFFVHTPAGKVEIDPREALWASRVKRTRSVKEEDGTKTIVEEIIPIGADVVFAGRWRHREGDCPLIEATGPESLVIFASPAGVAATGALRDLMRARRISLGLALAGAAALIALAAWGR